MLEVTIDAVESFLLCRHPISHPISTCTAALLLHDSLQIGLPAEDLDSVQVDPAARVLATDPRDANRFDVVDRVLKDDPER